MTLSPGQLFALSNLARKQAGEEVDWISIADARALTELGLAERSREGWKITAEGAALHQSVGVAAGDDQPLDPPVSISSMQHVRDEADD